MKRNFEDIINTEFKQTSTNFENVDFKLLVQNLESLKNKINNNYDKDTGILNNNQLLCDCQEILQEMHNRICEKYNVKPTIVNTEITDIFLPKKNKVFENGKYSFTTREININVMVNFDESKYETFLLNHMNYAWAKQHIQALFHETYHHIQMETLKKYINNKEIPENLQTEIRMLNIYFKDNKEFKDAMINYFLSPIEVPARKFAQKSIDYMIKNNILDNNYDNNMHSNYHIVSESIMAGEDLKTLMQSEFLWKYSNNISDQEKQYVEDFYTDMILYYKQINNRKDNIISNIVKNVPYVSNYSNAYNANYISLLALDYDYNKYQNCDNKEKFVAMTKINNIEANTAGFGYKCSRLPHYLEYKKNNDLLNALSAVLDR